MTLYEIDHAILSIVNPGTGEIEDIDTLNRLLVERDSKIEGVACWIKSLKAEAEAIRAEEKALAERRHAHERKISRLSDWLQGALQGDRFASPRCEVSYRQSTRVEIDDPARVLEWAVAHQQPIVRQKLELDKNGLSVLLKQGVEVPGARVETVHNMKVN